MSSSVQVALFLDAMRAMGRADEARLREIYHAEAHYWDPISGSLRGEEIAPYLAKIGAAYVRLDVDVRLAWVSSAGTAIEWTQTSQERGKSEVSLFGATFMSVQAGQIVAQRDYFDFPPRPASGRPPGGGSHSTG